MDNTTQAEVLMQIEHKVGMIQTFYKEETGAEDLICLYQQYTTEGTSFMESKLFLDDLNLFLDAQKAN